MARRVYVTGTNGKTTTTTMIAAIAAAAGEVDARVTTLGTFVGGEKIASAPTLEAFQLLLDEAARRGARCVAVEAASQALAEGFAHRFPPDVGVFTNLTRDHLDYHGSFEHYLASKAQLFVNLRAGGVAVLNACDPSSALLAELTPPGVERRAYATRQVTPACAALVDGAVGVGAMRVNVSREGTRVRLLPGPIQKKLGTEIQLRVIGDVYADDALAAAVACDALGFDGGAIKLGLESFAGVPGRFQIVREAPLVVVDYAHTPDALARTLDTARLLARQSAGRVTCVFGCGGDRDPGKRGPMGALAAELSDVVIVTTDNPRAEDPARIADAIVAGAAAAPRARAKVTRVADRAEAIAQAIRSAAEADVVIIAGKGHEAMQIIGDVEHPFDDAAVASAAR
ncbi:MAG TPA: UDP-N-acetylmuramyl-tripeptide synthetase [Byssovorax sp.]|jgi:UDP-N-acetylmuramoyl-L-alanyl-D-glutamate--2,6-diaminopimelate ligase